ncbi:MAG: hypothetical protein IJ291_07075 [Lachnospiraceae bacterium]|nr:hypothetical protein [Lachnospiraceae bacterium]
MRASIQADDGRDIPIMTMGPICIANDLKHQGYGKILSDFAIAGYRKAWTHPFRRLVFMNTEGIKQQSTANMILVTVK